MTFKIIAQWSKPKTQKTQKEQKTQKMEPIIGQFNRAYFEGDSKQGYHPPGYSNFPSNYAIANEIIKMKPESVLELGGGRGYISHILEGKGINATCLDVSKYCWYTRSCKKFVLSDATQRLPFKDKQFDLIFSKDFLEHISEDKINNLIQEMIRVSKRGFHLITLSDNPHAHDDNTHQCIKSKDWWIENFKKLLPAHKQNTENTKNVTNEPNEPSVSITWAEQDMENNEILAELHNIEQNTPLVRFDSEHWSRRVEYPWSIINSDVKKGDKILNVGSTTDVLGFYLCRFGFVVNLDNDPVSIDKGRQLATRGNIENITFKVGDIHSIPYPDGYFDKVLCIGVLEHIDNRTKAFEEMLRVLRPGGALILTVDIGDTIVSEEELSDILKSTLPQKSQNAISALVSNKNGDMIKISVLCIKYLKPKSPESQEYPEPYHYIIEDKEKYEYSDTNIIKNFHTESNISRINVGSFTQMFYGWENWDILNLKDWASNNGFYFNQVDITKQLPKENNSIELINCSHTLEHITREEGSSFIKDCYRILKLGGIIRIAVPDTRTICDSYMQDNIKDYKEFNIGVEKSIDNAQSIYHLLIDGHKTIYDFDSLKLILESSGFSEIKQMKFLESRSDIIEREVVDMYPEISIYVEATKGNNSSQPKLADDNQQSLKFKEQILCNANDTIKTKGPIITEGPIYDIRHDTKDNPLKIGLISTPFFVIPPNGYSGLEQIVWDLAEGLDKSGHIVTIFGPEGSKSTKHGFVVHTGPSINDVGVNWLEEERKAYEKYKDIITPEKFDIVHGHNWFGFEYLLKINNPKLKVIHTHHGGCNWESIPPVPKPNLVSISNYMKLYTEQYFQQKGYNVHSEYVRNGIDLDKYPFQPTKSDNLLFVGRLSTFKQPHVAIEVARKTNHKLDIVGGTFVDSEDYVKQLDKMVENDSNIKIYKDATHEFKIEKMQNAKALIFPSKMGEPAGLVAVESMSCGTAVIAFNDGAISEYVIHNKTGFICNSVDEMVQAVNNIHTISPKDCRKRARELSRQVMAENYVKLYQRILNNDEW